MIHLLRQHCVFRQSVGVTHTVRAAAMPNKSKKTNPGVTYPGNNGIIRDQVFNLF